MSMTGTFTPILTFEGKAGTYLSGGPDSKSRLLFLSASIKLRWRWLTEASTLAFYRTR